MEETFLSSNSNKIAHNVKERDSCAILKNKAISHALYAIRKRDTVQNAMDQTYNIWEIKNATTKKDGVCIF